jgi:transcriptional regulator with XRE-family HTH domain
MARRRLIDRRRELGLSQEELADAIDVSSRTIRNYEDGTKSPRGERRLRLAQVLRFSGAELTIALSDEEDRPINGHTVPSWLGHLASLEQAAGGVATFEPVVVPGLLQTAAYACAVEAKGPGPVSDDAVAQKVQNRIARQTVLDHDGFHLHAIVDGSVLHRVAGGRDVMADQLDHLTKMSEHPAVELRVLPLDSGVFTAAFGAFTIFTASDSVVPFMVCTEDRAGPHYLDRAHELEAHIDLFAYLAEVGLSPSASVDLIRGVTKEYR